SVLGNITTTMMWVEGVSAFDVLHAYGAAVPALFISGIVASLQQDKHQPIMKDEVKNVRVSWRRLVVSLMIIVGAVSTNVLLDFPVAGVWVAIIIGSFIIKTHWNIARHALP